MSVNSLLEDYQLTKKQCIRVIDDKHLVKISRSHCRDWRSLCPYLEIEDIVVHDIECSSMDETGKRQAFFTKWKQLKGSGATYFKLICALLEIQCRKDAESVCEILKSLQSDQPGEIKAVKLIKVRTISECSEDSGVLCDERLLEKIEQLKFEKEELQKELEKEFENLTQQVEGENEAIQMLALASRNNRAQFQQNVRLKKENKVLREKVKELEAKIELKEEEINQLTSQLSTYQLPEAPSEVQEEQVPQLYYWEELHHRKSSAIVPEEIRLCCLHCCMLAVPCLCLLTIVIMITLAVSTVPNNLPSGNTTTGNSDVVLLSTLGSSFIADIHIKPTNALVTVLVYHDLCSTITTSHQANYSRHNISNSDHYGIDEPYLIAGSQVNYTFIASGSQNSTICFHIFEDHSDYLQFVLSGHASRLNRLNCSSSNSPFSILLSTDENQYYFVGLESSVPDTIDYSVTRDVLEYNVSNMHRGFCNFTSPTPCHIPLDYPEGHKICILASVQEENVFITLSYYSTRSLELFKHYLTVILLPVAVLLLLAVCCCCCYCLLPSFYKEQLN